MQTSKHGVGYLDVALDPEGRERSDSRMAEETEPTSEIVFQTAGECLPMLWFLWGGSTEMTARFS